MYRVVVSLLLVILLVGCSAGREEGGNSNEEVTLNVAYPSQPPTLDPHLSNTSATSDISRNIFEQLVAFDENKEVAPLLAESYEEGEDGKTITFHLRQGVQFHNGKEMTADDVVASMERWRSLNGKAIAYLSDAEFVKEDDYTVVLRMERPLTIAKYIIAMSTHYGAIMPKEVIESASSTTGIDEYIGTGPYQFVEWKQDQFIQLVKNEAYQTVADDVSGLVGKREALVDHLYFHIVQDSSTRTAGIQTGEYDIALNIPPNNIQKLRGDEDLALHIEPVGFLTIIFNKRKGLFTDQRARQAVNVAIEKEQVMFSAFTDDQIYTLDHGLLMNDNVSWYNEAGKEEYEAYDPALAKKLLEEAGYKGETIRIITTRDYEDYYNAAVVIQQKLEQIGMKVDLQVYDWPTLLEKRADENAYEFITMGFLEPTDPTQIQFLDSRYNYPGWTNNPKMDKLLDEMVIAPTAEEAKEAFTKLQAEAWIDLPAIKYGDYKRVQVVRDGVSNFQFFHGPIFWNISKE